MATLKVKNVGPVRDAELEVKKHTIFIGPQGSGKSTLAKLIAIGNGKYYTSFENKNNDGIYVNYSISDYITVDSEWQFSDDFHILTYDVQGLDLELSELGSKLNSEAVYEYNRISGSNALEYKRYKELILNKSISLWQNARTYTFNFFQSPYSLLGLNSVYIPTERMLTSVLNNSVWGMLYSGISIPQVLSHIGSIVENSRRTVKNMKLDFLKIQYLREDNIDFIQNESGNKIDLSQAASGYQSIIPLLQVVEANRNNSNTRFIVEEPELNLYPTTQKDLIYALVSGLNSDQEYHDAEWVITTHSPYVLSSYNTLMLAYKVAQKNNELHTEVAKIIPERCWINPDDFAAYYVDNGTVRSIINPKTGLIMDNELDNVSEQFAAEQDQLLELNRSVPRD